MTGHLLLVTDPAGQAADVVMGFCGDDDGWSLVELLASMIPWATWEVVDASAGRLEAHPARRCDTSHVLTVDGRDCSSADVALTESMAKESIRRWNDRLKAPRCTHCGEPIEYRRGTTARGGQSLWLHVDTADVRCADGRGVASRPPIWEHTAGGVAS